MIFHKDTNGEAKEGTRLDLVGTTFFKESNPNGYNGSRRPLKS